MSQSSTPRTTITGTSTPGNAHTPATSLSARSSPSRDQSTSSYLEQLCTDSVEAVNQRDLDYIESGLYKHMSTTFRAHFDNFPHPLTPAEHSQLMRQTIEKYPDYHVVVRSVSSEVDEESGIAAVFMETEVTGAPPEIRTISVNEYRWRRDRGVWRCWLHTGMKGVSEYI